MRLYSSPDSVKAGEVTALAILETLIAASLAIFIASRRNSLMHIAIAASIAPFLLLRTNDSAGLALKWFRRTDLIISSCYEWTKKVLTREHTEDFRYIYLISLALLTFVTAILAYTFFVIPFLIRFISILVTTIAHPLASIKEIPRNWLRIVLSTDTFYPPEIFPGIELLDVPAKDLIRWIDFIRHEKSTYSMRIKNIHEFTGYKRLLEEFHIFVKLVGNLYYTLVFYLPSILFRLSLKSTSLIYLPIIWVVRGNTSLSSESVMIINDLLESSLERLKRCYSWFVLSIQFVIPLCFLLYQIQFINEWKHAIVMYLLPIHEIDSWHITRVGSAIITIFLFYYADKIRIRIRNNDLSKNDRASFIITTWKRVRTLCSLWTIGCGLYLVNSSVDWTKVPGVRWLPF